jgi:phosphoserine phosphatase RsbX
MSELQIGVSQNPARTETICGDCYTILSLNGSTTIGLADGLGHGPLANEAARAFCSAVENNLSSDLEPMLWEAHKAIAATRGVAAAVLRIDRVNDRIEYSGVGNIELQSLSRESIKPISMPGIVGHRMRKLMTFRYAIHRGDLLILHSDGISSRFHIEMLQNLSVQEIADSILNNFHNNRDDGTCIVLQVT